MRSSFLLLLLLAFPFVSYASGHESASEKRALELRPVVTLFSNYHVGTGEASGSSGFGLDRAYLGFKFKGGDNWSGTFVADAGSTKLSGSDLEFLMYIKNAYVSYHNSGFRIDFGLLKTANFAYQESFWGYRYVMKTFADQYGFSPSADMGIKLSYDFRDWFSVDFSFTNGKGYKKVDLDNNYRYGFGITLLPVEGFTMRLFYDIYTSPVYSDPSVGHQHAVTAFAGYRGKGFRVGADYTYMANAGFSAGTAKSGYSVYASADILKNLDVFARYDNLYVGGDRNSVETVRAGFGFRPVKYVSLSPNVAYENVKGSRETFYIYLNLLVSL